jgi:hypothetical protein
MKTFWNSTLREKGIILTFIGSMIFLPCQFKRRKFRVRLAKKLVRAWSEYQRANDIILRVNKVEDYYIPGGASFNITTFLGLTYTYYISVIALNTKGCKSQEESNQKYKCLRGIKYDQYMWQTLLHEMAHSANPRTAYTGEDHGWSFFFRCCEAYAFAWWQCFFGVLKN